MGHQGFASRTITKRRWFKKQKKKGLCLHCSEKVVEGKSMCQYHLDLNKKYNRKRKK